jgi:hypothetical protein
MGKLRNLFTFVRSCICDRSGLTPDRAGNSPRLVQDLGLADGVTSQSSAVYHACYLRSDDRQSHLEAASETTGSRS